MESLLLESLIYLAAAALIVPLSIRAGLGSVLGYVLAGVLMGPFLGITGAGSAEDVQHFAEFGVVIMLFLIGLELEPRALWDMRHRLLGLGGLQVVVTTAVLAGALMLLGVRTEVALTAGMIGSLSSTAIVMQTLSEKNLMRTKGGRATFSVLLMQDIAVIPVFALIPLLATAPILGPTVDTFGVSNPGEAAAEAVAETAPTVAEPILGLIASLPPLLATALTLGMVAAIILGGHYLSRPIFRFVHAAHLPEMSTIISLFMVLGAAFMMMIVGLSPALGTFTAGVVLANSEFRHQLEAELRPFKGLLLGLFFITVGMGINIQMLWREPLTVIGLTLGLILLKALVLLALTLVFRLTGRARWLFAFSLAQGGEFGFVLVSFARDSGALPFAAGQMTLLVLSLSMALTPFLFLAYDRAARRFEATRAREAPDAIDEKGKIIIAGVGRFGQVVHRLVRSTGQSPVVLDADMAIIERLRAFGVKSFFGDPSRPELLQSAGLAEAQVLVVAVDDPSMSLKIVRYARAQRPDLHIVARARDRVHVYELYKAGANDTVRETFDSAVRAGRYVLENTGFSDYEAMRLSQTFWRMDRHSMRELAELWVPGQPVEKNPAYVQKSKELERELEAAIMGEIYEVRPMPAEAAASVSAEEVTDLITSADEAPVGEEDRGNALPISEALADLELAEPAPQVQPPAPSADQPAETPASAKVAMPE